MKQESKVQVGVKSFIFNSSGQILVIKRNLDKYPGANNPWDIPGGRINAEQALEDNLKREIKEETGLDPLILQIIAAQDIIKPDIRVVRLTYISSVGLSPKLQADKHETAELVPTLSEEHSEYKWLEISEIIELDGLDSYVRRILKDKSCLDCIKDIISKHLDR